MAKEDEDLRDRRAAYHEAGHAVIAWCFGRRIEHVTIVPSGDSGGHILYRTDRVFEWERPTETWLRVELLCTMAGPVAQNLELGENAWGVGSGIDPDVGVLKDSDADTAGDLLLRIDESREDIESGAASEKFEREVQHLLDEFWPEVQRVAEALLKERTLSQERLAELLD